MNIVKQIIDIIRGLLSKKKVLPKHEPEKLKSINIVIPSKYNRIKSEWTPKASARSKTAGSLDWQNLG